MMYLFMYITVNGTSALVSLYVFITPHDSLNGLFIQILCYSRLSSLFTHIAISSVFSSNLSSPLAGPELPQHCQQDTAIPDNKTITTQMVYLHYVHTSCFVLLLLKHSEYISDVLISVIYTL